MRRRTRKRAKPSTLLARECHGRYPDTDTPDITIEGLQTTTSSNPSSPECQLPFHPQPLDTCSESQWFTVIGAHGDLTIDPIKVSDTGNWQVLTQNKVGSPPNPVFYNVEIGFCPQGNTADYEDRFPLMLNAHGPGWGHTVEIDLVGEVLPKQITPRDWHPLTNPD